MSEYWFAYFGPLVVKTEISESFQKKLLLEGKKSKTDYTKMLAGMIKEEFLIENPESWFIPEFSPLLSLYQNIVEQDWSETADEIQRPFEITETELPSSNTASSDTFDDELIYVIIMVLLIIGGIIGVVVFTVKRRK